MIYAPTFVHSAALFWTLSGTVIAMVLVGHARIMKHYERTGQAVALPDVRTRTKYRRLPKPVLAVRVSFFVIVAAMLVFGLAPMRDGTSHIGITASVLALLVIGLLSVVLERYYISTGRAEEIPIDRE